MLPEIFIPLCFILLISPFGRAVEEKDQEKVGVTYTRPESPSNLYFVEPFHNLEEFKKRWVLSEAKKDGVEENISKYDGKWAVKEPKDSAIDGDLGLILLSAAKHSAISAPLETPFTFDDKPLIVQYEVRFQNKQECGGAYIKLLADEPTLKLKEFGDKVEYSIMFGPDKCGTTEKLHFIFQHKNPITGNMEEKHAVKPAGDFSKIFTDGKTHLLTLILRPDNSFEILLDKTKVNSGNLLNDMEPPVNPPKEIDDPNDHRPEDWDEREEIPDPDAKKPEDWDENAPKKIPDSSATKPAGWLDDEPELIPDPAAVKPEDWDDEEDGEWEAAQIDNPKCKDVGCGEWTAPMIDNPAYKGVWSPPMIKNPKYKGIWEPRKIPNPEFFEDTNPFAMKSIAAVGFELWSMQSDIVFDNLIIADNMAELHQWTGITWDLKHAQEVAAEPSAVGGLWTSFKEAAAEKPWLWVVAGIAILLPIVLIYVFCLSGKTDDAALHKKTDAVSPDDNEPEEDEENKDESEEKDAAQETKKESTKPDISPPVVDEEEQPETDPSLDKQEEEKAEEQQPPDEEEVLQSSPRTRAARRKTRKDN